MSSMSPDLVEAIAMMSLQLANYLMARAWGSYQKYSLNSCFGWIPDRELANRVPKSTSSVFYEQLDQWTARGVKFP